MAEKQGRYTIVDTTLTKMDATVVDELSGRQGDNGRIVYFAIKDGDLPHDLTGQDVNLNVKDSAGKVKIISGIYEHVSDAGGLFSLLIPGEVYQAIGDVQEAFLSVTDSKKSVVSSIPIAFTVFENGIVISANASQDYIGSVQKVIDSVKDGLEGMQSTYDKLEKDIASYIKTINDNAVALKAKENEFTQNNTFDKDITVKGSIKGTATEAKHAASADKATDATNATNANNAKSADSAKALVTTATLDNEMKVHSKTINGFGGTVTFTRVGNTVTVMSALYNNKANFKFNAFSIVYPSGTIPTGYRPARTFYGLWFDAETGSPNNRRTGMMTAYPDGQIGAQRTYVKDSNKDWTSLSGTYVTSDDMPKD